MEAAILEYSLACPTQGAQRVAGELPLRGIQVSLGGVRGVWSRHGLMTKHEQLLRLEETARQRKLKLTDELLDCFSRYAWGRLYTSKLPLTAVQVMNNDVLPFFEEHRVRAKTVLSDNGREFCGRRDRHPYELFLPRA